MVARQILRRILRSQVITDHMIRPCKRRTGCTGVLFLTRAGAADRDDRCDGKFPVLTLRIFLGYILTKRGTAVLDPAAAPLNQQAYKEPDPIMPIIVNRGHHQHHYCTVLTS